LFADATLAEAALSLDRIRERWAAMTFCPAGGSLFRVTSTFGAAALHEGMTAKALVEAADQALYRAKQSGRNRVGSLVS
jgi:diguanylate cyclase (GGDEF)-like protein